MPLYIAVRKDGFSHNVLEITQVPIHIAWSESALVSSFAHLEV